MFLPRKTDAFIDENAHIVVVYARIAVFYGLIGVVYIVLYGRGVVLAGKERKTFAHIGAAYARHVRDGMEYGGGGGEESGIGPRRRNLFAEALRILVRHPTETRHVQLVVGQMRRGVQKPAGRVVEQILAVVGTVHQRRAGAAAGEQLYDSRQHVVCVENRVVVGIDHAQRFVPTQTPEPVGLKMRKRFGVALPVIEMRAVHVEYDEQVVFAVGYDSFQNRQHVAVRVHVAVGIHMHGYVGLRYEVLYHRTVWRLVRYGGRAEPCIGEKLCDASCAVHEIVGSGIDAAQHQRYAFIGGVALRQHAAEPAYAGGRIQTRRGVAAVSVCTPREGPRGFSNHENVYFPVFGPFVAFGPEAER